jgi:hypothetical protein
MSDVPRPVGDRYISAGTPFLKRRGMKRGCEVAGSGQTAVMNTFAVVGMGLAFSLLWRERGSGTTYLPGVAILKTSASSS